MRILILTQKIDRHDTVLGFFHNWVREIAVRCDSVIVIALGVGEYDLPQNVHVLSLGKEAPKHSRVQYVLRFYWYILRERNHYDEVFVHMNDEYVVLGGWVWKLLRKKISHWRNHPKGGWMIDFAMRFSDVVYATSPYAYVKQQYPDRVTLMPVGVDTDMFCPDEHVIPIPHSLLFFGRLSPIKKVHLFLGAVHSLKQKGVNCVAHIIGDPHNPEDTAYVEQLHEFILSNHLEEVVTISPGIPNREAPALYRKYEIFVNLTTTGSFDKTIFEAMATGVLVATSNGALKGEISDIFICREGDEKDLVSHIMELLSLSSHDRIVYGRDLRGYVVREHSLRALMSRLFVDRKKTSIIG